MAICALAKTPKVTLVGVHIAPEQQENGRDEQRFVAGHGRDEGIFHRHAWFANEPKPKRRVDERWSYLVHEI